MRPQSSESPPVRQFNVDIHRYQTHFEGGFSLPIKSYRYLNRSPVQLLSAN
jgi:hypothetical protein